MDNMLGVDMYVGVVVVFGVGVIVNSDVVVFGVSSVVSDVDDSNVSDVDCSDDDDVGSDVVFVFVVDCDCFDVVVFDDVIAFDNEKGYVIISRFSITSSTR